MNAVRSRLPLHPVASLWAARPGGGGERTKAGHGLRMHPDLAGIPDRSASTTAGTQLTLDAVKAARAALAAGAAVFGGRLAALLAQLGSLRLGLRYLLAIPLSLGRLRFCESPHMGEAHTASRRKCSTGKRGRCKARARSGGALHVHAMSPGCPPGPKWQTAALAAAWCGHVCSDPQLELLPPSRSPSAISSSLSLQRRTTAAPSHLPRSPKHRPIGGLQVPS